VVDFKSFPVTLAKQFSTKRKPNCVGTDNSNFSHLKQETEETTVIRNDESLELFCSRSRRNDFENSKEICNLKV